jgi:diaminopimelate decarboxylase
MSGMRGPSRTTGSDRAPLTPWPDTARLDGPVLEIAGCRADDLAGRFGTPLYVYDALTLRARARAYADAVARHPGGGFVAFAAKANPAVGVLRLLAGEGLGADVSSAGELAAALRAGMDPARVILHGNAKPDEDLEAAVRSVAGLVVVDSLDEPARVAAVAAAAGRVQPVAVRVTPGIRAGGHVAIETGGAGSKFGLPPEDAARCVALCREEPALRWRGLHIHLGSQIEDAAPLEGLVAWLAAFCAEHRLAPELVDLGGGLAIAYGDEAGPDPGRLAENLVSMAGQAFPEAELVLEPGRSVAGPAGVLLYRVVSTKAAADGTRWVAVDGGMSDNVRPAMYGARYTVAAATRLGEPVAGMVDLAGRHCESGDVIARNVPLPQVQAGDVVALPGAGAYAQSMASSYNGVPRAAAVMVEDGEARLITRRETVEELLGREL